MMIPDAQNPRATPLLHGYGPLPLAFNIETLFAAVKALNDAADKARAEGWTVELLCADYATASATKAQKGNGPA